MSRITHFKVQPKNIQYWDYYILCHLDVYAATALQRFEYWDGTKRDGNVHAEDINDILEDLGEEITQDASRFFYKAQDELQWELMGLTGEKYTANLINFLVKELNYLEQRNNPSNAMDRKKQYLFRDELVQDHVNYLGYIIDYFKRLGFRLNPVYYAIEQLTAAKVYIDTLNIASVIDKLTEMYAQMEEDEAQTKESKKYKPTLPKFIRMQLNKDTSLFPRIKTNKLKRFRTFAEWKTQICGMDSVETRDANSKSAESIPQESGSNSNNYRQQLQTITTDSKNDASEQKNNIANQGESSHSSIPLETIIILSPEERHVFDLVCQVLYKSKAPEITAKVQEQCNELVKADIKTLEDIETLVKICRQNPKLKDVNLYLGNLITTAVLNGWKQNKNTSQVSSSSNRNPQPTYVLDQEANERRKAALRASIAQKEGALS